MSCWSGKFAFVSRADATKAALRHRVHRMQVYECPDCGRYHLTSQNRNRRGGRRR